MENNLGEENGIICFLYHTDYHKEGPLLSAGFLLVEKYSNFVEIVNEYAYVEFMYRLCDRGINKNEYKINSEKTIPIIYLVHSKNNHVEILDEYLYSKLQNTPNRHHVYRCLWSNVLLSNFQVISILENV